MRSPFDSAAFALRSGRTEPEVLKRGERNDHDQRQQSPGAGGRRARDSAPLRAARPARVERRQVRLRVGAVRRVHGAARQPAGLLLPRSRLHDRNAARENARIARQSRRPRPGAARFPGGAGGAMRVLHRGHGHARTGAPRARSVAEPPADPAAHEPQPVPVRHAHAHREGRRAGCPAHGGRGQWRSEIVSGAGGSALSRRQFLAAGGALVVSFSLSRAVAAAADEKGGGKLPGSLKSTPWLDSWIRIAADGTITVYTGKAELGQGIKTAVLQVAAEELIVEPRALTLVTADTAQTPDERYTAGSQSMQDSATAVRHAAAQVRALLVRLAAEKFGVAAESLTVGGAAVRAPDGRRAGYGELVAQTNLHVTAQAESPLRDPATYTVIGKSLPRVDIPPKLTGTAIYVQDLRLPGMVHARVVRPPSYGARLRALNAAGVEKMPGVLKVVRDGNYLAVVAEREYQAIAAMRALAKAASWVERGALPTPGDLYASLQRLPSQERIIVEGREVAGGGNALEATYR